MAELARNKKASFDYKLLETLEAGLLLLGHEVKAVRTGKMGISSAYIMARGEELYLVGATISPSQPLNTPSDYNPARERKLLLHKDQIAYLLGKSREKGLTLIPTRVYTARHKIKLELAVAVGRKKFDKREQIKKREAQREIRENYEEQWHSW